MFFLLDTSDGYVFYLVTQGFTSLHISRKVSVKKESKNVILHTNYYIRNIYNYIKMRDARTFCKNMLIG